MTAQTHPTENQRTMIINHLMTKGPLTVLTAIEYIGCYALSQRVGEIRQKSKAILLRILTDRQAVYSCRW